MIVAIHQPHFLPWLGYLHRMQCADLFVILDHVQFERRNYQNRTQIRLNDRAHWLTVPVVQRSQKERIVDKAIDHPVRESGRHWAASHFETLRHAYGKAPFFDLYAPRLAELYAVRDERLTDLNARMLEFLREALSIRTPLVRSAELGVEGRRMELILNLCLAVGADTLLAGMGGSRGYLDEAAFAARGVRIRWHDFRHPRYAQRGDAEFVAGLSALDLLFNCGPMSRSVLLGEAPAHDLCAVL